MAEMQRIGDLIPSSPSSTRRGNFGPSEAFGDCGRCGIDLEFDEYGRAVQHRCCECQDTRRVRLAVDRYHPAFGKAVLCEACDGPPVVIGDVLGRIGVPMRYRAECIEDWRPADGRERQAVERYVATWPPSKPFLALIGARGLGKTMLGVGILRACRERHNATGLFRVVPDLLDDYRRTQDPERATESMDDLDDRLTRVPVLVLDDLGVGRQTEFGWERLYVVINRRYNDGRATVITTNVDLLGIEDRVRSRMLSGEVVMFSGRDQRLAS